MSTVTMRFVNVVSEYCSNMSPASFRTSRVTKCLDTSDYLRWYGTTYETQRIQCLLFLNPHEDFQSLFVSLYFTLYVNLSLRYWWPFEAGQIVSHNLVFLIKLINCKISDIFQNSAHEMNVIRSEWHSVKKVSRMDDLFMAIS